jgi:hypothetical protein
MSVSDEVMELEASLRMYGRPVSIGQTWLDIGGRTYGARADDRGPLGGGSGYRRIVTGGDFTVATVDQMLDALARAKEGQVVFVPGDIEIDCTTRVHIEKLVFKVPAGVTVASDRGNAGSRGALVRSDTFDTPVLFEPLGPDVRLSGLRLRGPDPDRRMAHHARSFTEEGGRRGHPYYYKFPISTMANVDFPRFELDNCELAGWSHAAVYLRKGGEHRIHHNYIHHCQYNGLGYGVCLDVAQALIECNLFDSNRHSIAATGRPGSGYEAANNVQLGVSLSHCFDMHGGRDRQDGTNIAGSYVIVHHNTFQAPNTPVVVRGVPEREAVVTGNWFVKLKPGQAVLQCDDRGCACDNAYGETEVAIE